MKKNYILGITLIAATGFLALQQAGVEQFEKFYSKNAHLNSAGAPAGKTGAPGETSCADCHGASQSGSGINTLVMLDGATPVTNYVPGTTYNMVLNLNASDVREGFQSTVLEISGNSFAGDFTGNNGFGTAITSFNGRKYANHTSSSNTSANQFWSWEWQAPATDLGPIRFYIATNIANGNSASSGDAIYLSEHLFGSTSGIQEIEEDVTDFSAGFVPSTNEVSINFSSKTVDGMFLNLVDLSGKSVFVSRPGNSSLGDNSVNVALPSDIKTGVYVVNFLVGNKAMKSKIMIQ